MNVKEMPRRVEGDPVVKGTFLGWVRHLPQGPGYACFVITHDHDAGGLTFRAHLMRADGLDKPWKSIEGFENLTVGMASELFERHGKLAEWPEGNNE
ncbi:hypothetical protein ACFW2V_13635 [Streptomyces sp. NPDC058947]|uniref:hypothetical protein n=1 Tax=Streptomyces sp. NPDC058947 TaxID=3346675 RepID=UPI0036C22424